MIDPGQVEDPRHLGREVPAAGEDLRRGPSATTTPSPSSTTRSAKAAANSTSWVATTTAAPAPARPRSARRGRPCGRGPCPASARRARRARAARRRPSARQHDRERQPLPLAAGEVARVGVDRHARARRSAAPRPRVPRQLVADPLADQDSRPGSGSAARPRPAPRPCPRTGSTRPAAARSSVLLPAPLRPISATRSPGANLESIPRSDSVAPRRRPAPPRDRESRALPGRGRCPPHGCRADPSDSGGLRAKRSRPPSAAGRLARAAARIADPDRQRLSPASEKSRAAGVARAGSASRAQARKSAGRRRRRCAPASMAMTRSAAARQRSSRCSASSTATPHSSFSRRSSQISSSPATGSSCEVGSSSRTSRGRVTSAAASATRCSSPPESVSTVRSSRCGIASASATSSTARAPRRRRFAAQLERQLDLGRDGGRDDLGLGLLGDVADDARPARPGRRATRPCRRPRPRPRSRRRGSAGPARRRRAAASTCRIAERPASTTNSPAADLERDVARAPRARPSG